MEKLKNIPSLRFPEFRGNWEVKKLKEVADIGRGKSKHRPRDAEFLYGGKYPFIQTGDIRKAGLYLTEFTQTYSEEGLKQSKLWLEDTLCITIAANIAETSILKIKACFPDSIIGLIPSENKTTVLFVKHLFDKFKIQIQSLSQGAAQDNLNQEKLSNIEFVFPELIEQTKITSFLSAVDEKLQALKQKKALLEQYKKGVMQKIFSQELRFKDDNGNDYPNWEEKKLSDIANKKSSSISANKIEDNFGDYIIYGASGILKKVDFYKEEDDYISIIKDGAGVGRLLYCKGQSSVLGTMEIIRPNEGINTYYLYCLLSNIDFVKYVTGSTIPHIYFKDYSSEICGLPCLEEQTKIANFLLAIYDKINHCEVQIEKTEVWKKGLLQQMFC
jgi:type I restriction enzyme, S subunit